MAGKSAERKLNLEIRGRMVLYWDSVPVPLRVYRRVLKARIDVDDYEDELPAYFADAVGRKRLDPCEWDGEINAVGVTDGELRVVDSETGDVLSTCPLKSIARVEVKHPPAFPYKGYSPKTPILGFAEEVSGLVDVWRLELEGTFDPTKLQFSTRTLLNGAVEYLNARYAGRELEAISTEMPGAGGSSSGATFAWTLPQGVVCTRKGVDGGCCIVLKRCR